MVSATVTVGDASASEGDALTFTVTLDKDVPGGLTVTPSFSDGTATKGTDYTENTTALTFSGTAGETQSFTVSTSEDEDIEEDETFTVSVSVSGTSHSVTASGSGTGTITNDDSAAVSIANASASEGDTLSFAASLDAPPVVSATVTVGDASASEGDALTFTVTLDKDVPGGLTVTPSFSDGTATKGTDYTENTTALTFSGTAGETQSFTVSTSEDKDVEANETFTVSLAVSGTSHRVTAGNTATGTITNDDDDNPYLSFDSPSVPEGDSGTTTLTFTARLTDPNGQTKASTKTITAHYEVLSEGGNTATAGTDYTATSGTLTFAPGETSKTIGVSVLGDTDVEEDETLTVKWTGWENVWLVSYTHTGTIINDDDDSAPVPDPAGVTIADAKADEGDAISFTVTLDKAVSGGLTVTPSFTDGTATKGTDYTENTTALSFTGTAGETQTFSVSTTEDEDVEADETFTVGLTVSGTSASVTATDTATGTITNDDSTPVPDPAGVTIADAKADEGDAISFTVTLDKAVSGGLTVTPSFTDGTATKGTDYTENTTALTFTGTAGETQTFSVSTTEDEDVEADETFTVGLTVSGTSASVTATDTATGTITNDDSAPVPDPAGVTITDAKADEGDAISFTVTLDKAVSAA